MITLIKGLCIGIIFDVQANHFIVVKQGFRVSHLDGQAFEAAGRTRRWPSWLSCEARSSRMESIAQMSPHSASFHLRGAGRVALSGNIQIGRASCRERVCQYV